MRKMKIKIDVTGEVCSGKTSTALLIFDMLQELEASVNINDLDITNSTELKEKLRTSYSRLEQILEDKNIEFEINTHQAPRN